MQDCLTSVHADIARLALVGKYFSQPILNLLYANYTEVSVESSENTKHFLLFYYYGGMIAASVKNFSRYVYGVEEYQKKSFQHLTTFMSTLEVLHSSLGELLVYSMSVL